MIKWRWDFDKNGGKNKSEKHRLKDLLQKNNSESLKSEWKMWIIFALQILFQFSYGNSKTRTKNIKEKQKT